MKQYPSPKNNLTKDKFKDIAKNTRLQKKKINDIIKVSCSFHSH